MKRKSKLLLQLFLFLFLSISCFACNTDEVDDNTNTEFFVEFELEEYTMYVGDEYEIIFESNITESLIWSSSDDSIASVVDGIVQAHKKGTTIITAESESCLDDIIINVQNAPVIINYYNVTIGDDVHQIREGVALSVLLNSLYYGKTHLNHDNKIFNGWFLDASFTIECDIKTKVTDDIILYPKYTDDNNECPKIAVNNIIGYNGEFIDNAPLVQIFSPSYGKTTAYQLLDYKDQFMVKIAYNTLSNKYLVIDSYYDGIKSNLIIPFNGFIIAISKNCEYISNYQEYLKIGSLISLDHYSVNISDKIYINRTYEPEQNNYEFKGTVSASYMSVYDVTNEYYLYEKNSSSKAYPASVTKIITALAAIKYADLNDIYLVGDELDIMREGSSPSTAGLKEGQEWTLRQLLYALLLPSGNDAAYSIAAGVAKNIPGNEHLSTRELISYFADLMNEIASDLQLSGSHFMVPDGNSYYKSDNSWDDRISLHYVTANDMVSFANYAFKCGAIAEVVSTFNIAFKIVSGQTVNYTNTNLLIRPTSDYYYPYAVGIKTGTTNPAGNCLISGFEHDGRFIIIATLNSSTSSGRYSDTLAVIKTIFDN